MLNVFKGTILSLARDKGIFVWSLAFPVILSTLFLFMFANLDENGALDPIPCVVVADVNYDEAPGLADMIDELSQSTDDQLLEPAFVKTEAEAIEALEDSTHRDHQSNGTAPSPEDFGYVGYLMVDDEGTLSVHMKAGAAAESFNRVNQSILQTVADSYVRKTALIEELATENPAILADTAFVEDALSTQDITEEISVTYNQPSESVRYYFALFGMAALFGGQIGMIAICRTQPNLSPLGARRALGGISRAKMLAGTLGASWLLSFGCLLVAFLYVRFVAGIDFGGRDAACILVLGAASLMATAFGTLLGSLPKVSEGVKSGILTGVTCFASLFAGLYGQPTMHLADSVNAAVPALAYINPATQIAEAFYSVMYYDTWNRLIEHVGILILMAAVLFAVSTLFVRRQRYASL